MIKVNHLSYHKNGKNILNDISFTFQEGKTYGIIGPNGAGKSTLLKQIMGLMRPSQGEVLYKEKNIIQMSAKEYAKKVSFVFQENTRQVEFSVYEMLLMGKYIKMDLWGNLSKKEEQEVDEILEELKISHLKQQSIHTLSGGEAQKVFIGRALLQNTPVLLLDEPTSMLDVHNSVELMHCIGRLKEKRNLTIIMVLHELNLAMQSCEELLLMEEGQIVKSGTSEELLESEMLQKVYHQKLHLIEEGGIKYVVPKLF